MRRAMRTCGSSRLRTAVQDSSQPHLCPSPLDTPAAALSERVELPPRAFRAGEWLRTPEEAGRGVFCLQRGIVGLRRRAPGGRLVLLSLLYPGDVYVATDRVRFPGRHTGLQAVTGGAVTIVDSYDLLTKHPQALDWLIAAQHGELEKCEERIVELATLSASAMLARHLLDFSRLERRPGNGAGEQFVIPLSRRDMASLLCIRPETLARLLKGLVAQGCITLSGRHATVVNEASLREVANDRRDRRQKIGPKIDRYH